MAAPGWIQLCRRGAHVTGHCLLSFTVWSLWLALLVLAGYQTRVWWAGEVRVPDFLTQRLVQQLAAQGLEAEVGAILFDPRGRLLMRDLDLHAPGATEPLLTARAVYARFDPWELLVGRVDLDEVELVGARLYVPAMLSPSGRAEAVINQAHLTLAFDGAQRFRLVELVTRVGHLPLTAHGDWLENSLLPRRDDATPVALSVLLRRLARHTQEAALQLSRLPPHEAPRLSLVIQAEDPATPTLHGGLLLRDLTWTSPAWPPAPAGPVTAHEVAARFSLPLSSAAPADWLVALAAAEVSHPYWGEARGLILQVEAAGWPHAGLPDTLAGRLQMRTLRHRDYPAHALTAQFQLAPESRATGEVQAFVASEAWSLTARHDSADASTILQVEADLAPALLGWAERFTGRELSPWLTWARPARLALIGRLDPAGLPVTATGHLSGGPAMFRGTAIDFASADFVWRDHRLHVTDLALHAGPSHVRGSYSMDTATLDFRFLLAGALEPAAINGWFRPWWRNLWANFAFPAGTPATATLDARGRWRDPDRARVFVAVDATAPTIRGVPLTRARTRIFARPEFTDVLSFVGERPEGGARGAFTVNWDRHARALRHVALDLHTELDLEVLPALLPQAGTQIAAPFELTRPPLLHLRGRVNGPASRAADPATHLAIVGTIPGDWELMEYPLRGARFRAAYAEDRLLVNEIEAGLAGGVAEGRLELAGRAPSRRLSFDLSLRDATLGQAIRDLEVWGAERQDLPIPPRSRFQQRTADGRLNLALSATGPFGQPLKFAGEGYIDVTEATLGEVNLLGILSTLLRRTLLDFSTLELDTARSNFTLAGDRVFFPDLVLTGSRAAVNASGDYHLGTRQLAFNARVQPFEAGRGLLGSTVGLVLSPLSHVLEVRLGGTLAEPSWAFTYGPTSLLRALGGGETPRDATPPAGFRPDEG
jgi:hypothetical protein